MSGSPVVYPHVVAWVRRLARGHRSAIRVLEAGCGGGQYAASLPDHEWIGFDIPETWYEATRLPSFYASASQIPVQSGVIDLVFSVAAFDYFEHPEQVLLEFHRVLRTGGRCLIFTYDEATLEMIHRNCQDLPQTAVVSGHHVTNAERLREMALAAGFSSFRKLPYMPWSRPLANAIVWLRPTNHRVYLLSKG